jgi:hypothetical protein
MDRTNIVRFIRALLHDLLVAANRSWREVRQRQRLEAVLLRQQGRIMDVPGEQGAEM